MSERALKTTITVLALSGIMTGCGTSNTAQQSTQNKAAPQTASVNKLSTTSINQIGTRDGKLDTAQIMRSAGNNLTVDQLKVYADRCRPNSTQPVPAGLDCSEIRLRMKRVFRSDDKVAEALFTLNRLSQNDKLQNDIDGDLKYGNLNADAVASQAFQDLGSAPPEEAGDFTDFLEANGLSLDSGAIIIDSGGG